MSRPIARSTRSNPRRCSAARPASPPSKTGLARRIRAGCSAAGPTAPTRSAKPAMKPAPRPAPVPAPVALKQQVLTLAQRFDGKAGIAIVSLRDGWEIGWNSDSLFPQQSCSKLWVAITAMDAVDRGKLRLDDRVTLGRGDLTLFHQPLREKVLGQGAHTTTLGSLLFDAITESDNTANDKLMR